jgi:predicted porin
MKLSLTVCLMAASAAHVSEAAAADGPDLEIYGSVLPFLEYVGTSGATVPGFTGGASQVPAAAYTGTNDPYRFRMTAGTSNIGFRGSLDVVENLKLIWQVESAVPIDGNGPPNTFASRNSQIGFAGGWGSLTFGIWDTPWKTSTLVTLNPIMGGYVPDYTSVISTPGFGVGALNTAQGFSAGSASNAAFYRREANSIQYWSPTVAGFSARLAYTINEGRNTGSAMTMAPPTNPYLFSGYVGWDGGGFRIRYAYELHHDYFGMAQLGGTAPAPAPAVTSSSDMGHQVTAQYTLTATPTIRTRLAATAEFLRYKSQDTTADAIDEFSRPAFYGLIEQSFSQHHVWIAYGQALEGNCGRVGGGNCSTSRLGAKLATLGYLFAINERTNIHLVGYRVFNDNSARYVTFPPLSANAPGADTMGVGVGVIHVFNVGITGRPAASQGPAPTAPAPAAPEPAPPAPAAPAPAPAAPAPAAPAPAPEAAPQE